jgi:pheromone shutdown protein TraB
LGAATLGGAAAYISLAFMGTIAPLTSLLVVVAEGLVAGIVGLAVAGTVLAFLENQEYQNLVASLRRLTSSRALEPYDLTDDPQSP